MITMITWCNLQFTIEHLLSPRTPLKGATTIRLMTLSITTFGITILSIRTLSITKFGITTLIRTTFGIMNTQHEEAA
jgi:hypothetical protein